MISKLLVVFMTSIYTALSGLQVIRLLNRGINQDLDTSAFIAEIYLQGEVACFYSPSSNENSSAGPHRHCLGLGTALILFSFVELMP